MGYLMLHWSSIYSEYTHHKPTHVQPHDQLGHMSYKLQYLRVKIHETNFGSIRLFESVGFRKTKEGANYFGEIELRWKDDGGLLRRLRDEGYVTAKDVMAGVPEYAQKTDLKQQ